MQKCIPITWITASNCLPQKSVLCKKIYESCPQTNFVSIEIRNFKILATLFTAQFLAEIVLSFKIMYMLNFWERKDQN